MSTIVVRAVQQLPRQYTLPGGKSVLLTSPGDSMTLSSGAYNAGGTLAAEIESDMAQGAVTVSVDGVVLSTITLLHEVAGNTTNRPGTWNKPHFQFYSEDGSSEYHEWRDAQGNIRRKAGSPPTSEGDGFPVTGCGCTNDSYGAGDGQQYGTDVKAAADAVTGNTASTPKIVHIGPGTYTIQNPIVAKEYTIYQGAGKDVTFLVAANGGQPMFTDTGASGWVQIRDMTISQGTKVIQQDNSPAISVVGVLAANQTDAAFVANKAGGELNLSTTDITSVTAQNQGLNVLQGSATWEDGGYQNTGNTTAAAVKAVAATNLTVRRVTIINTLGSTLTRGMDVDQANVEVDDVLITSASEGVYMADNTSTSITGRRLRVVGSANNDINFENGDAFLGVVSIEGGEWDTEKLSGTPPGMTSTTVGTNDPRGLSEVTQRLSVGVPNQPRSAHIGGGAPFIAGMIIKRSDNLEAGPFTDLVPTLGAARSGSALFGGNTVGRCIYLGLLPSTRVPAGFDCQITTAQGAGGLIVVEGWDTLGFWTIIGSVTQSIVGTFPYSARMLSDTGAMSVKFDQRAIQAIIGKTVDGVNTTWLRLRITTQLTTDPILQWIEFHANASFLDALGGIKYLGAGRRQRTVLARDGKIPQNDGASLVDVDAGVGIVYRTEAGHPSGSNTHIVYEMLIEEWMCLASGWVPFLRFKKDAAAAALVDWKLTYSKIKNGDVEDSSSAVGTDTVQAMPSATADLITEVVFASINIADMRAGDVVMLKVERLGADAFTGVVDRRAVGIRALIGQSGIIG